MCYYWRDINNDTILYVGSVTKDYKGKSSNFWGRIRNYLNNHGKKTTNKHVFDEANKMLLLSGIEVGVFSFSSCSIAQNKLTYKKCCIDPGKASVICMIEEVLICFYRTSHQCEWNK
jgi:hypothetical protein